MRAGPSPEAPASRIQGVHCYGSRFAFGQKKDPQGHRIPASHPAKGKIRKDLSLGTPPGNDSAGWSAAEGGSSEGARGGPVLDESRGGGSTAELVLVRGPEAGSCRLETGSTRAAANGGSCSTRTGIAALRVKTIRVERQAALWLFPIKHSMGTPRASACLRVRETVRGSLDLCEIRYHKCQPGATRRQACLLRLDLDRGLPPLQGKLPCHRERETAPCHSWPARSAVGSTVPEVSYTGFLPYLTLLQASLRYCSAVKTCLPQGT